MKEKKATFTLRIDGVILEKLASIAQYNGRTKNKEISHVIRLHIAEFEKRHGQIQRTDDPQS